jgi:hypothetical protein
MKTKNKILLFTLIVPFILVVMVIVSIKKSFNDETDSSLSYSEEIDSIKRSFDFNNFEQISAEGFFSISLTHDDHFSIELVAPETAMDEISVSQSGQTLLLKLNKNSFSLFSINKRPRINITLPSISRVDIKGVADISFTDFSSAKTSIFMEGVVNVTGKSCLFDQFSLSGTGVMNVSMDDMPVTSAHFEYSGVYNINMHMNGGSLTGKLDGIGKMIASGEIGENSININPPGSIKIIQQRMNHMGEFR